MKEYYYNLPGTQDKAGPVSEETLRAGAKDGTYPPDTLVWSRDMPNWKPLRQVLVSMDPPPLPRVQPLEPCPSTHMAGAIVLTIIDFLLFLPLCILGIIAIVKAGEVETLWRQGRIDESRQASHTAGVLNTWNLVLLLLPVILLIVVVSCMLGGMALSV